MLVFCHSPPHLSYVVCRSATVYSACQPTSSTREHRLKQTVSRNPRQRTTYNSLEGQTDEKSSIVDHTPYVRHSAGLCAEQRQLQRDGTDAAVRNSFQRLAARRTWQQHGADCFGADAQFQL